MDASDAAVIDVVDVQDVVAPDVRPTYLGTEFWAVTTTNSNLPRENPFSFAIAVGNPSASTVEVTVTGGELTAPRRFTVSAGGAHTEPLPWVRALSNHSMVFTNCGLGCCDGMCCDMSNEPPASAIVRAGAYRIAASSPVTVYQFNPLEYETRPSAECLIRSYTNDASLLLPTPALGQEYLVLTHGTFAGFSFVTITGTTEMPARVRVVPTAAVIASRAGEPIALTEAGQAVDFELARGDVVQLLSNAANSDFTGTTVSSTQPISVVTGVDCTNISNDGSLGACDHIEEQLFPVSTWGTEVAVSALRDRGRDERYLLRVLAAEDDTVVTYTPSWYRRPERLRRGQYVQFSSNFDVVVSANKPILVAQYMMGQQATPGASTGDPAMVYEVPTRQYRSDYVFVVPSTYTTSFVQLVTPRGARPFVDGRFFDVSRDVIEGTPWMAHRGRITPGTHTIRLEDGQPFGVKVIGIAPFTSYMYPGGLDLAR